MAVVYGANRTKILDPKGNNILDPGLVNGRIRVITDSYVCAATTAGYITMGPTLPVGAVIMEVKIGESITSACTLAVGTSASTTKFIGTFISSLNAVAVGPDTVAGCNYVVTGSSDNCIVIRNSGGVNATGTIKVMVKYAVD